MKRRMGWDYCVAEPHMPHMSVPIELPVGSRPGRGVAITEGVTTTFVNGRGQPHGFRLKRGERRTESHSKGHYSARFLEAGSYLL